MAIEEIRKNRINKIRAIESAGFLAYPSETKRTCQIKQAFTDFKNISKLKKEIFLTGRIRSLRGHGGSAFIDIEDGTAKIQAFLKKDNLGEKSYDFFIENFDVGDFVCLRGVLFKTKKGEKTINVSSFKMLAKNILPLPEKWHGLKDVEDRFRKRYLDLIFNKEAKEKFEIRFKVIKEIRNFLEKEGFLEVETPVLQPICNKRNKKFFGKRRFLRSGNSCFAAYLWRSPSTTF